MLSKIEKGCKTAMSSRNGSGITYVVNQISDDVAAVSLDSTESPWEIAVREPKNKGSNNASYNPWPQQNTAPKAWVTPASHGSAFPAQSVQGGPGTIEIHEHVNPHPVEDDDLDSDDDSVDSDDELLSSDFDSDASDQSFELRKKNKWLKAFFIMMDTLTVNEINEPARQWHCPACQGGPGAINWFRGLQCLMTHAKTKGSIRVKLHREFAELLDEELRRRGTSVIPPGEVFGKWKGLKETVKDHEIVWPPMVVVMNTKLEQDENDKWIGMGNQELLDCFHQYAATKARHSYGPQGHRGVSMLIFESSAIGYLEAELLHEHFKEEGTDREAWDCRRVLFYPGGKRQLYGYMAEKQDLDYFNQHSQGKSRLKYELRSYHEMVVSQLRRMNEDNQQLVFFKDKVAKVKKHSKVLEESYGLVSEKLRRTLEENRIVRQRSKVHHEQNKQEMDFQEDFFNSQIKNIHDARDAKEDGFERLQQEQRQMVIQSKARREDEIANFIKSQDKEIKEFVSERDKFMKIYEEERAEMKRRHHEEEVELEKKIDAQLNGLMAKYTPHPSQ